MNRESTRRGLALRLPTTVVLLGFTSLFTDVGTEMIFPLLPVFLTETLRAGPAYLGLVEGAANTVASLLKLASGIVADLVPRRKPLVLFGYGLASAVRPFVALATRPWHVLAVRIADRVGKGIRSSPRDALIADAAGERVGRAFGFHQAMDNAGAVVGPLLATALMAGHLSMRDVFWVAVIPGAIATALVAFVRERGREAAVPRAETPEHRAAPASPAVALGPSVAARDVAREDGAPRRDADRDRALALYLVILTVFSLGNSSDAFLLLRAHDVGLGTATIPILWAALNLSKVFWAWFGGDLADRFSRARIIVGGWVAFSVVYAGLGFATAVWQVWALFVAYGAFYGLTEPVEKALVKDLARVDRRGRAYGVYNFVIGITSLPAGLLTGWLWHEFGAGVALGVGAALAFCAALGLVAWDVWRSAARRYVAPS